MGKVNAGNNGGDILDSMAKGQPVTKEEVLEILTGFAVDTKRENEKQFAGFRKDIRGDMVKVIFDFHKEVQEPMTEEILTGLKDMGLNLKNEIGRLERKLDKVTDHQAEKLDDHEGRIGRIEAIV